MVPAVGVEEEYLLLDAADGAPKNVAEQVLLLAREEQGESADGGPQVTLRPDLLGARVVMTTPLVDDLRELRVWVGQGREVLARAATQVGAVLAPVGAAPVEWVGAAPVLDVERFREIHRAAPALGEEHLVNGLQISVEVPDRDTAVTVMNRTRPWLHVLLALSANSPLWRGRDTGFASWRAVQEQRWGVEGPAPSFRTAADYDRRVDALVGAGIAVDRQELRWSMRLSEDFPGVQVRVTDVQLEVDSTLMLTSLARALAMAALRSVAVGAPEPALPGELLRGAAWQAARHGATGDLLDLLPGRAGRRPGGPPQLRPAADVVAHLLHLVSPVAADAQLDEGLATLAAVLLGAGGEQRQRRAVLRGGMPALLDLLAVRTGPPRTARPKQRARRPRLRATG